MPLPTQPPALSLALAGIQSAGAPAADLRERIPWVRKIGFSAVHLNAAAPGIRPRDLDRSARRDLAAIIRREGLDLSGADLWIPPEHFLEPAQCDRAIAATLGTIELLADMAGLVRGMGSATARPVLSLALPGSMTEAALGELTGAADRAGVRIADHTLPHRTASPRFEPAIGIGIDPAALLASGLDPAAQVSALGARVASARLSDVARNIGGGRVIPGSREGKLDLLAYAIALATSEYRGWIVADTRSLTQPEASATAVCESWRGALAPGAPGSSAR